MNRRYWRIRAAIARWQTRHHPRPFTDELLRRIYGDAVERERSGGRVGQA